MIREKKTVAGKLLQADFYPCWSDGRKMPSKAPKRSSEAQIKYNNNKAAIEFVRLVNENFDNTDYVTHPTVMSEYALKNEEEARNIILNFKRRVKYRRQKELEKVTKALEALPDIEALADQRKELEQKKKKLSAPFKFAYVIGKSTYQRGKNKGKDNWHFHVFMTGGIDRSVIEDMWPKGMRCNVNRFQPERFGPESMARYMINQGQGARKYACSRNMTRKYKNPKIKNSRLTPSGVERIAKQRVDDAEYWEKKYPGYRFIRCFPRFNKYNGHWYVSVLMWKTSDGPLPKWSQWNSESFDTWFDDDDF